MERVTTILNDSAERDAVETSMFFLKGLVAAAKNDDVKDFYKHRLFNALWNDLKPPPAPDGRDLDDYVGVPIGYGDDYMRLCKQESGALPLPPLLKLTLVPKAICSEIGIQSINAS